MKWKYGESVMLAGIIYVCLLVMDFGDPIKTVLLTKTQWDSYK